MKIACIGGGPGGLYFALLMKQADPSADITVYERNPRGSTYGWGVVFSDEAVAHLFDADPVTARRIGDTLVHWDDIEIHYRGTVTTCTGHGFSGIERQRLLDILEDRAEQQGVVLRFETEVDPAALPGDADLIVAADGVYSRTRTHLASRFRPDIERRFARYVWLGTRRVFEAFTFIFEETEHGWFQAHAYRFAPDRSTFIVECDEPTWLRAGLDRTSKEAGIAYCERLFARHLRGHRLESNSRYLRGSAIWQSFHRVHNERWHHGNVVLLGDAAHTAHFSVGSGTRLAVEDAMALVKALTTHADRTAALARYEEERRVEVLRLQNAARNSTEWFESVGLKSHLAPEQFAYSLLTRSQRVSHENLRTRDAAFVERLERWFSRAAAGRDAGKPLPPMFTPFRLRGMEVVNRVVVSPMAMYSAGDGTPGDFHLVHFGARALGGAGLIFTEMTCVSPDARISPGCAGMYRPEHVPAWRRIVDFVHANSEARFALQLGHAGRKGSTRLGWEGMDEPLDEGNWPLLAPSPVPYGPRNQIPREMTRADMDRVIGDFVRAARMGVEAGFDMLELHCAHGYLLSSFITPLSNRRTDRYGGALGHRMRFPLEVLDAVRAVWPEDRPISVRISAVDWVDGGIGIDDAVRIARLFREHGADLIDVSTGQTSREARPVYGRMYQTPFSDRIRSSLHVPTMAVGNIYEPDHVNSIIMAGRADLCALARPHLGDPAWTLRAAAQIGYEAQPWPKPYLAGKRQLEVTIQRAAAAAAQGAI